MKRSARLMVAAGLVVFTGVSAAQTTTSSVVVGQPEYFVTQLTGVVVAVEGNSLLAQLVPDGDYRWFDVVTGKAPK